VVPWAHRSPNPKRHLDRFSCLCRSQYYGRQTDRPRYSVCCNNRLRFCVRTTAMRPSHSQHTPIIPIRRHTHESDCAANRLTSYRVNLISLTHTPRRCGYNPSSAPSRRESPPGRPVTDRNGSARFGLFRSSAGSCKTHVPERIRSQSSGSVRRMVLRPGKDEMGRRQPWHPQRCPFKTWPQVHHVHKKPTPRKLSLVISANYCTLINFIHRQW